MKDRVVIAVTLDGLFRARAARTSRLVGEALLRHAPAQLAAEALARALTTVAIYPASWKDSERVSIQWSGQGALGTLLAESRAPGRIRGFVTHPGAEIARPWKGWRGIGHGLMPGGFISVMQQDHRGAFTRSQVELRNGEIDEDLEGYFEKSEQVPTRVRALVAMNPAKLEIRSAGVLVQALPDADPAILPDRRIHEQLDPSMPPEALLEAALQGRPFKVVGEQPIEFACPCSRERIEAGMGLLALDELEEMVEEDQGARARCDFCATTYTFSSDDLRTVIARKLQG